MRIAILSDIHANLEALTAVLHDVGQQGVDRVVVLGDLVGYGPDPRECLARIRALPGAKVIRGNHDQGVVDDAFFAAPGNFNDLARQAIAWTRTQLGEEDLAYLRSRELRAYMGIGITGAHATLHDPEQFDYLFIEGRGGALLIDEEGLAASFAALRHRRAHVGFVGHTHLPVVFADDGTIIRLNFGALHELSVSHYNRTLIACVGAVGQARGTVESAASGQSVNDAYRACYVIVDDTFITFRRVDYEVAATAAKITANPHLPDYLGERLLRGE